MDVIFGPGVTAPDLHRRLIMAIPGDTSAPVKRTIFAHDLTPWHTSGFRLCR